MHIIRAPSSEFGTYRLCEQRRFRRACASAQSRQNLRCSLIQAVNQEEPSDRKPDPWPLWMAGHAQLKFVMTECSKTQIRLTGLIRLCFVKWSVHLLWFQTENVVRIDCMTCNLGKENFDHVNWALKLSAFHTTSPQYCLGQWHLTVAFIINDHKTESLVWFLCFKSISFSDLIYLEYKNYALKMYSMGITEQCSSLHC